GGRGVLELLLRAEQHVEHLGTKALVERDGQASANQQEHEATPAPLLLAAGLGVPQRVRRVLQGRGRLAELLLGLLVLGDRLDRSLAVGHAGVRLARRFEGGPHVLAQLLVLDDPLHVRVVLHRLPRGYGAGSGLGGLLLLRCHASPRVPLPDGRLPGFAWRNQLAYSSRASLSTWSIFEANLNLMPRRRCGGISSRSASFNFGAITHLMPAR